MATVYGTSGTYNTSDLRSDLEATLGATLATRILNTLKNLPGQAPFDENGPAPQTVADFDPSSDQLPNGTSIVVVDPTVHGNVQTPKAPIVIYASDEGVGTVIDATSTASVYFGGGDDNVTLNNSAKGTNQSFYLGDGSNTFDASNAQGNVTLDSGDGNTVATTGSGADTFNVEGGGFFDGNAGFDVANFTGNASDYQVTFDKDSGHVTVKNLLTNETSILEDINYINVGGKVYMVLKDEDQADVASFYEIVLNRSGDAEGAKGWLGSEEGGTNLAQIADGFLHSDEFTQKFGNVDTMSNTDFVKLLYANVFDRDAGQDPLSNNWVDALNKGLISKAELVATLAKSAETEQKLSDTIKVHLDIK